MSEFDVVTTFVTERVQFECISGIFAYSPSARESTNVLIGHTSRRGVCGRIVDAGEEVWGVGVSGKMVAGISDCEGSLVFVERSSGGSRLS